MIRFCFRFQQTGIFIIGVLIARILAGRYVDNFGPKKLYFGFILSIITTFGYFALSVLRGARIGPLSGMTDTQNPSFNVNLILCACLVVISFLFSLFLRVPEVGVSNEQVKETKGIHPIFRFRRPVSHNEGIVILASILYYFLHGWNRSRSTGKRTA